MPDVYPCCTHCHHDPSGPAYGNGHDQPCASGTWLPAGGFQRCDAGRWPDLQSLTADQRADAVGVRVGR